MPFVLGIDSGGSGTRGAIADANGRILARAEVASIKLLDVAREQAEVRLDALLAELTTVSGVPLAMLERTCVGLSGYSVGWLREQVAAMLLARTGHAAHLCGDEEIAMAAAAASDGGRSVEHGGLVLVMAGTGSHAMARAGNKTAHAGGWGPGLGDEGGGGWIGRVAAAVALRAYDDAGRREPELLLALKRGWGAAGVAEFVAHAHAPGANFASLAPAVADSARGGDALAAGVLGRAGEELARLVLIAARHVGSQAPRVAWTGSILRNVLPVREAMQEALRQAVPGAEVDRGETDPVLGAVQIALQKKEPRQR